MGHSNTRCSGRIFTVCSPLNRLFFMAPPGSRRGKPSGFSWSEKRQAGHHDVHPNAETRETVFDAPAQVIRR